MAAPEKSKTQKLVPLLLDWFSANARDLPWRRTRDPYAIWVSEIMLQQTQVKTVIPFWNRWLRELPTIADAANAPAAKIHKLWEGLGYYTRVRNLQKAAQQIVAQHETRRRRGDESQTKNKLETPYVVSYKYKFETRQLVSYKFPENFDEVLALPGIGRYTAGAICSIAFNQPTPILDGNVIRVLTRIFGVTENPKERKTNARLWQLAEELVALAARRNSSRSSRREAAHSEIRNSQSLLTSAATIKGSCSALNQSLMELGALVCTPRSPQCDVCPVKKLCVALHENRVEALPNLGKREAATARRFLAFVVGSKGKFFVRQRPAGVVNAQLWEFPNVEVAAGGTPAAAAVASVAKNSGFELRGAKPLCTIKHSITRYRITLEAWRAELSPVRAGTPAAGPARNGSQAANAPGRRPAFHGQWRTRAQLHKLAFTGAHKKILGRLGQRR